MSRFVYVVLLGGLVGCAKVTPVCPPGEGDGKPDSLGAIGFERVFTEEDGLGPLFNLTSCVGCHEDPPGGPGDEVELHAQSGDCNPLPGGPVFQTGITQRGLEAWGSGEVPPIGSSTAVRSSPGLFASGLIDRLTDEQILSHVDLFDLDGDGVEGFASFLDDGRIGRFGRKGQVASLREFVAAAYRNEMGVTTEGFGDEGPNGLSVPFGVDVAADPEVSDEEIEAVVTFISNLRLPKHHLEPSKVGKHLFTTVGCATCHVPQMGFTDVLMHSLGEDGADICFSGVPPAYFRTEPLLGLRLKFGDGEGAGRFMHDGGALDLIDAINRHGGEGLGARGRFNALDQKDQEKLLEFLKGL